MKIKMILEDKEEVPGFTKHDGPGVRIAIYYDRDPSEENDSTAFRAAMDALALWRHGAKQMKEVFHDGTSIKSPIVATHTTTNPNPSEN